MQFAKRVVAALTLLINFESLSAQKKITISLIESKPAQESMLYHTPADSLIRYTGRIENQDDSLPKFWSPGIYITAKFKGAVCEVFLNDEELYGNSHNYIEVIIDNDPPERMQMKWKNNEVKIEGLNDSDHTITICKNTESGIGYLEFAGINCYNLLKLPEKPVRKIEFIGNSITCGSGMDQSEIPCGKGQWYDQHNALMSYGPLTSRALNAQWVLSSVSGIGLIHSCCNMNITMPQVFDKVNMRDDSIAWNFLNYTPDVVTICLGQNDGVQDSAIFCSAYIYFIQNIRNKYKNADIICLTSPMGDATLTAVLKNYLNSIVIALNNRGDKKVYKYFFSKQYHNGCGGHPDLNEHKLIAAELTGYIKQLKQW
jgi:Carbohydrate esterase 2 N-terminal/GDSL-like Lipase/Acylhydrolase family